MPKGRHLKPDFFTDKHIVAMSPLARLLYQGLWCYAADCGHLDDEPIELKMRILPADNCDVDELLDEIVWHKRIVRKDGVIEVPNLAEHQKPDKRYMTLCDACKADDVDPDERKRWGLHKRWHTDRDIVKEGCEFCSRSEHVVSTTSSRANKATTLGDATNPQVNSAHVVTTTGPRSDHVVDGDGDGDGDVKSTRKKRSTSLPDVWKPTEKHWERRHDGIDVKREAEKFRLHAEANDRRQVNWNAAFSQWLLNARPTGRPTMAVVDNPADLPPIEDSWMRRRPQA